jgi:hypothetical protein
MTKFFYDDLVMTHILSYIGTRKSVSETLLPGVYVLLNVSMSSWRTTRKLVLILNRFKIISRDGNRVMLSRMEQDVWLNPYMETIHRVNNIETIKLDKAVWKCIQPKHKLDCLFTRKEWFSFSLYELCKRYMDEIDEDIHRWWSNYY